jgi:hypothetical protein
MPAKTQYAMRTHSWHLGPAVSRLTVQLEALESASLESVAPTEFGDDDFVAALKADIAELAEAETLSFSVQGRVRRLLRRVYGAREDLRSKHDHAAVLLAVRAASVTRDDHLVEAVLCKIAGETHSARLCPSRAPAKQARSPTDAASDAAIQRETLLMAELLAARLPAFCAKLDDGGFDVVDLFTILSRWTATGGVELLPAPLAVRLIDITLAEGPRAVPALVLGALIVRPLQTYAAPLRRCNAAIAGRWARAAP